MRREKRHSQTKGRQAGIGYDVLRKARLKLLGRFYSDIYWPSSLTRKVLQDLESPERSGLADCVVAQAIGNRPITRAYTESK